MTPTDDRHVTPSALRVLGPYQELSGFRLVILDGNLRKSLKYKTWEEAAQAKAQFAKQMAKCPNIGQALAEYQVALSRERGCRESTAQHTCARLARFLPTEDALSSLNPNRAEALYRALAERLRNDGRPLSVATHHLVLNLTKSFFHWCVEKGYVAQNPFAKVRKLGKPKTGKPQLTANEARRFLDAALSKVRGGDSGALAIALQLLLGLRSSEVLARRVRDVDENGTVLLIPDGKTPNARRRPHVPDFLQPYLLSLIQGKPPEALLFGEHGKEDSRSTFLRRKVHKLCQQAGVPLVCPHSLRGLHATLALRQGLSSQAVAAALGHGSFAITARHYADPSVIVDARVINVLAALGRPQGDGMAQLAELARNIRTYLSPPDIDTLIGLLKKPTGIP